MSKLTLGVLFLLILSAVPLAAQPSHAQFVNNDCVFTPPYDLTVECGTLTVPEDRSDPDGNQVRIAVAVFRARDPHPAPDPIFFLDGGPGASTLANWGSNFKYSFADYNQTHDVVLFDDRGVGASEPSLFCDEVSDYISQAFNDQVDHQRIGQDYISALRRCHDRLVNDEHLNLRMYQSAVLAQDVNDLREALGYDQIDLLGGSYGTRLALTILRDHPAGIRSVLLDGVYPPQVNSSADNVLNSNRAFEELFNGCARSIVCNQAFPDLRSEFYATANRLNQTPATLRVNTLYGESGSDITFNGDAFINYIFNALYSTWLIPSLPLIIHQVADGNYDQLAQVVGNKIDSNSDFSLGLYLTIQCGEEAPFNRVKDTIAADERVPLLGEFYLRSTDLASSSAFDECALWSTGAPDSVENQPVKSSVPVLIFNGEFDPVTPPNWGELAAKTLPNSQVITFPGVGHGASFSGSTCARQLAVAFFDHPETRLNASCIDDTPIHWVTVDLSDSLAAMEAKLDATGDWTVGDHQSNVIWNRERWDATDDAGHLLITDYLATVYPQRVDQTWFDRQFGTLHKYLLQDQCTRGSLSLYEFKIGYASYSQYQVRYWVNRSNPDMIRETVLTEPDYDQTSLDDHSEKLFPQLPTC